MLNQLAREQVQNRAPPANNPPVVVDGVGEHPAQPLQVAVVEAPAALPQGNELVNADPDDEGHVDRAPVPLIGDMVVRTTIPTADSGLQPWSWWDVVVSVLPTSRHDVPRRTWTDLVGCCFGSFAVHDPMMPPLDGLDTNHTPDRYAELSWLNPRSRSYVHRLGYRYTRFGEIYLPLAEHLFNTNMHTKITTQRLQALSFSAASYMQSHYEGQMVDASTLLNTVQLAAIRIRVYNLSLGRGVAAPDGEYAAMTTQ